MNKLAQRVSREAESGGQGYAKMADEPKDMP